MPTLPSKLELGAVPNLKGSRQLVSATDLLSRGGGVGGGLESLGAGVSHLGVAIHQQQDEADKYEAAKKFTQFELSQANAFEDHKRSIAPDGKDFANNVGNGYDAAANSFFGEGGKNIPESQRQDIDQRLLATGVHYKQQAYAHELNTRDQYYVNDASGQLQDNINLTAKDPTSWQANLARGEFTINRAPVTPPQRTKMLNDFRKGIAQQVFRAHMMGGEDIDSILKKLDDRPTSGRPTNAEPLDITPIGPGAPARVRQTPIQGVVIHHTGGSSLDGAIDTGRKNGTGANYYIDRDGSIKQWAPEGSAVTSIREPGSRYRNGAHANLNNDNTVGIEVVAKNDADVTPAQRARVKALVGDIVTRNKLDPNNVVGHGEIQGGPGGNREPDEGLAAAKDFRDTYQAAAATTKGTQVAQNTKGAGGNTLTDESPVAADAREPNPYDALDPKTRESFINIAKVAQHKQTWQAAQNDIAQIRATGHAGAPPADKADPLTAWRNSTAVPSDSLTSQFDAAPDESKPKVETSFDRAKRILTPNQYAQLDLQRRQAEMEHAAIAPLKYMTADQAASHLDSIQPKDTDSDYALKSKVAEAAAKAAHKLDVMRQSDPAQSVSDAEEVRQAQAYLEARGIGSVDMGEDGTAKINAAPEDTRLAHETLIEARLAAQAARGIPDYAQKPVSKAEAIAALGLPPRGALTDDELDTKLKEGAQRIQDTYGKYATPVLKAALNFYTKKSGDQDAKADAIASLVTGTKDLADIAKDNKPAAPQWDSWFKSPELPQGWQGQDGEAGEPNDAFDPWLAKSGAPSPDLGTHAYTSDEIANPQASKAGPYPAPSDKHVEWVQQDPAKRQSVFDQKFGPGAYARSLQGEDAAPQQ